MDKMRAHNKYNKDSKIVSKVGVERTTTVSVTKEQLESWLKIFLKTYRSHIRKEYPAYFNEFPFYGALKAIGVITHNKVYSIFTKDGNPRKTTVEVLDETDMPDLMRVKDALYSDERHILALLAIKTYIWDVSSNDFYSMQRKDGHAQWFNEESASKVALRSIRFHYGLSVAEEKILRKLLN